VPTVPVTGRADLTDAQWTVLEPLLPRGKKPGRRRNRAVATRYDKLAVRYEATLHVGRSTNGSVPAF